MSHKRENENIKASTDTTSFQSKVCLCTVYLIFCFFDFLHRKLLTALRPATYCPFRVIFEMSENEDEPEQYGILDHPSGIILPKILRSLIPMDDDENEVSTYNSESKYRDWTVEELYRAINQASQQLLNVQSQISNGEDYYINNLSSISIYNSSKNFDASFLDSRNEYGNSASGIGPSTSAGMGGNSNAHRWFSSSLTDLSMYQQTLHRPELPRPVQPITRNVSFVLPVVVQAVGPAKPSKSSKLAVPSFMSNDVSTATTGTKAVEVVESTTQSKAPSVEEKTKPSTRKSERPPPPERRTTKRRRKSTS